MFEESKAPPRPHLWLIKLIGVIVPRRLRADWRQEWQAELQYREALLADWDKLNWKTKFDLVRRSLGAFWDALLLQPRRLEDDMFQDLKFGVRMLLKNPGFTVTAMVSLIIGIGATSAIFSVVNGVVLRPLPYKEPEQLVRIWHNKPEIKMTRMPVSGGNLNTWREQAQSFESVAAFSQTASILTNESGPEQVQGARVSANLLPMLGYQPLIGRGFLPDENKTGNDKVVILSYKLWQQQYGGDETVLGSSITLDHTKQYTIIGVMPPEVSFPGQSQFWLPETATAAGRHDMRGLSVLARLKPEVTSQMAKTEIALINEQLQQELPGDYKEWEAELQPLHEYMVGSVRTALLILFGAVTLVLLIACANVANLLLARATARQKEMAVRAALGASRWRLIRQMLTESTLLALIGGAGGLLLAKWAVQGLIALNPPDVPRLAQVNLDARVIAFTFFTTLLVGIVFGLAPALHASKLDLNNALKEGASSASVGRLWLRSLGMGDLMVVAQTALAIVLLAGSGLLIKSFINLRNVELGFTPTSAIMLTLSPAFNRLPTDRARNDYYQQLLDSLKTMPGVDAVATTTAAPTAGAFMNSPVLIVGQPEPANADTQRAYINVVSSDYFRAIGNPVKQGRGFTEDDNESATHVAVINETMARTFFGNENPLGQRIALRGDRDKPMAIVGITADVKQFGVDQENKPGFYQPYRQKGASMNLVVRTTADPATMVPALRDRIFSVDKFTAITRVRTLDDLVSESIAQPRFYTLMLAIFAGIALMLAAVGIYGLMAYLVGRRTHEIGIRIALGAETTRIVRLVVGHGLVLIAAGVVIGLAGAMALTRLMTGLLFGVSPTDPAVFVMIAVALTAVALAACFFPARKATRINPMVALRTE